MKSLKSSIIVYDDECPMCEAYTSAFVKTGMLENQGRIPYSKMDQDLICRIDKDRARNEIALVDIEKNAVTYGIESLYKIIGNSFPLLWTLFRFKPFDFIMKKVYAFISYNRKVIVPSANKGNACVPDMNMKYRVAFIVFAWFVSAFILNDFSSHLVPLVPASNLTRELFICGGQLIFQGGLILFFKRQDKLLDYLGNLIAVSLMGGLLLLPALLISASGILFSGSAYLVYFLIVVGLLFLEHKRRAKLLGMPSALTAGWLLYRLIVLVIIL